MRATRALMLGFLLPAALGSLLPTALVAADKTPKPPKLAQPVLFDTPQADQLLATLQIFPATSAWHEDVSKRPLHPDSQAMIAHVGADRHLAWNFDMGFIIVPPNQPKVAVKLVDYPDESEPGPYPLPDGAPIEGWPLEGGALEEIQRTGDGDRHVIVVDPFNARLYEFYQGRRTPSGWQAACAAVFDLSSNQLRPAGWTSSDAAGLPIFPAIARFDECERGRIDHALRFTITSSRKACVYPATHQAGRSNDPAAPRMGERFRLKATVPIDGLPKHARAIAQALKTYGMLVADNGGDWRISVAPDRRIQGLEALRQLKGSDFEVVLPTGEHEGPRAPGAKK
jgi:hypothetical protein